MGAMPLKDAGRVLTCLHLHQSLFGLDPPGEIPATNHGGLRGCFTTTPIMHLLAAAFPDALACKVPDRHIVRPPKEGRANARSQPRAALLGLSVSSQSMAPASHTNQPIEAGAFLAGRQQRGRPGQRRLWITQEAS